MTEFRNYTSENNLPHCEKAEEKLHAYLLWLDNLITIFLAGKKMDET